MTDNDGLHRERAAAALDEDDMAAQMMLQSDEEMSFVVYRTDPQPTVTFSEEAMVEVNEMMRLWVATRIWRRWRDDDIAPTRMRISVAVEFDPEE
jgi:hypothetical protein